MKLVAKALLEEGHAASDDIGTLHFPHWVPFEKDHLGFFTIFDGPLEKYMQDFATTPRSSGIALPACGWRAAHAGRKDVQAFYESVFGGKQLSGYWVLQRLSRPLGSRRSIPLGDRKSHAATTR